MNPFWDEVQELINRKPKYDDLSYHDPEPFYSPFRSNPQVPMFITRDGTSTYGLRRALVGKYSWAIPSPEAIQFITEHARQGIVEIGAGVGYWAAQLTKAGISVMAYDVAPTSISDNIYHQRHEEWHPVMLGRADAAAAHPDRALFLCWPPYTEPMGADALTFYRGDTLIYIGESGGGCCGDDRFHDLLEQQWEEVARCDQHWQWDGIRDTLTVHKRKVQ